MGTEILDLSGAIERRVFVKGLGWVSGALLLSTLGGCESCLERISNRPIRRRLRSGSPEVDAAIVTYKRAVQLMKALPANDPRNWYAQAGIHGTVTGGFKFCQHGTNHFFSWHRAYLFYFEQICQELTGDKKFGLPYWNWNQDPQMHSAFTDPASPLNHLRANTSVAGNAAFSDGTLDTILGDTNFFTFSSQLEGSPHNMAHNIVGQDMVTGGSPLDPVFWAHHCMVDYCWAKWNIELGDDNTNDAAWNQTGWNHFVDGKGNPVSNVTAGATTLMPLLSYQYESSAIGSSLAKAALSAAALRQIETRLRKGAEMHFEIKKTVRVADRAGVSIARPLSLGTRVSAEDFAALLENDTVKERIFLSVDYAHLPPTNDFFIRVFISRPGADVNTPTEDAHYAGSFAFFGTQDATHGSHGGRTEFLVNVTNTIQELKGRGEFAGGQPISVQLVAVPVSGQFRQPEAVLVLEKVDLLVSPVLVRSHTE